MSSSSHGSDRHAHVAATSCPECGVPLELGHDCLADRTYEPPTDEQLARFVTVMVHGAGYSPTTLELTQTMLELPELRKGWLDKHRQMQEDAWNL